MIIDSFGSLNELKESINKPKQKGDQEMKTTDYEQVATCPLCKKPVYSPASWTSKRYTLPTYPTCPHVIPKTPQLRRV